MKIMILIQLLFAKSKPRRSYGLPPLPHQKQFRSLPPSSSRTTQNEAKIENYAKARPKRWAPNVLIAHPSVWELAGRADLFDFLFSHICRGALSYVHKRMCIRSLLRGAQLGTLHTGNNDNKNKHTLD